MKEIKVVIYSIKMFFKLIIDTWKSINRWERDMEKFSKPLIKALKEYRKEMRQKAINENSR